MRRALYQPDNLSSAKPSVRLQYTSAQKQPSNYVHSSLINQNNFTPRTLTSLIQPHYKSQLQSQPLKSTGPTASSIKIAYEQTLTYKHLLYEYDQLLMHDLRNQEIINNQVLIMQVELRPEKLYYTFWKSSNQIRQFLIRIKAQVDNMNTVNQRKLNNADEIRQKRNRILKIWDTMWGHNKVNGAMDLQKVTQFIQFLNMIAGHAYLNKSLQFLTFINHCLPLDKWNMLIYQQAFIYKPFGVLDKFRDVFSSSQPQRKKAFFLTITSDGLIKSDDHLLLSKVEQMIPFTNLMKVSQRRVENNILYSIKSGRSQAWDVCFYDDIQSAINFGCALGRARMESGYKTKYNESESKYKNKQIQSKNQREKLEDQEFVNTKPHRFSSFAPPRDNCGVKMYVDGCGYFQDLYAALMNAKRQICITDWMLTPYFLLRRPDTPGTQQEQNLNNRLDGVLLRAARRGVKIYIILFMQPALFVNNDSQGAQKRLQSLHKNIKVMRHPNVAVPIIWSHHQKLCVIDQSIGFMGGFDICYGRWDTSEHKLVQDIRQKHKRLWDGCDYNNFRTSDIYQPRQYWNSNLNQEFQVRMPWHDIGLQMRGDSVVDLLRHFVQYWYFVQSQYKLSPRKLLASIKGRDPNIQKRAIEKQTLQYVKQAVHNKIQNIGDQFFQGKQEIKTELLIEQRTGMNQGNTKIQMLRSANTWSIGGDPQNPQRSIHEAYKQLIINAKSHIYIQNQFFMGLKNEIVETLCKRIIQAHEKKEPFKVIIVVPLLPGFEGDPGDATATVLRIQIHWQKVSIHLGEKSIYSTLTSKFPNINITDYLFFFGLRKHDILKGSHITQIIYVHSKLMIVDDQKAICGSANINDRSLWGSGDSQIAVCIQETQPIKDKSHLFDLRCRIYDEHFKLTKDQSSNITRPDVWAKLLQRVKTNTLIYREVFGCVPDDTVTTHQEIQVLASLASYNTSKLQGIIGHAVQYPLHFMDDQDLQFSVGQMQYYAPVQSFT